ncbi:MAG TPA: serine/threonine-protein kinase, partial [Planctomycetaceae bacterium]|nr:serine/threonine-protein kinase [Planctomycetaceae bacterium]
MASHPEHSRTASSGGPPNSGAANVSPDRDQTVLPHSRDPKQPETISSSAGGTSVTGTNISSDETAGVHVGPNSELGHYRLLKKLGEGGMGSVWEALHTKLDKHVAVKVLPATWSRDPALLSRFEREMKAVGKLEHPHIIRAMDAGEFQGTHYLVMEFNDGQDLSQWVKSHGPQSVANACEMLRHAALGLAHAHKAGLIHRDIKPSNLFLTKHGKVKILDLGLARVQGDNTTGGQTLTGFGQVLGTPDYMAPEQWENTHAADGRSDLYALGCTLFYLLTGHAPFSDERHSSLVGKMKGHTLDPIPNLKTARREAVANRPKLANDLVSDELDALYHRLMSKRPEDRFATADELAEALLPFGKSRGTVSAVIGKASDGLAEATAPLDFFAQFQADAETQALPDRGARGSRATDQTTVCRTQTDARGPRAPQRRWWLVASGLVGVLLLIGIIITIKHKDGSVTEIKVPDGSQVEISGDDASRRMASPGRPAVPNDSTNTAKN